MIKGKKEKNFSLFFVPVCALYFGPVIKHNGIHRTVNKAIEPFYRPFVVQWQHSRTKRQRDVLTKGINVLLQKISIPFPLNLPTPREIPVKTHIFL